MRLIKNDDLKRQFIAKWGYDQQFSFDVAQAARLYLFPAKSTIVQAPDRPHDLLYLVKGKTKLYDTLANGKVALIDFFTPPCFIGEMELLDPQSPSFTVQAIEDCWCLALPMATYREQLLQDTTFLRCVCQYLGRKNTRNIKTFSQNQAFTLSQRLAGFILLTANNMIYEEKHTQVAQYFGVSYHHLLYVLADFVKQGYLEKAGHHYRVRQPEALARLAHEVEWRKT
ncbi:transcriptional regulator YeiL [Levilactobacillus tujiorum]|uniref:Transcriptional regulator YeiL n=1 Tax=Levilactobacillus tujiorum TaxID=2912243 RepID=A0ABX1L4V9_9LACO|nr:transcriptional regulator YeiL [Levilactobacillus tujiorum]NLR12651.1 transcriptional regulator YeiL [Lactobacillus sp. HBUAS51387]NLR29057.1 transcriptional regulator YeiL [Levilactobacillus tujiorum]